VVCQRGRSWDNGTGTGTWDSGRFMFVPCAQCTDIVERSRASRWYGNNSEGRN